MSHRDKYAPGPANLAEVKKDGDHWTLVLVRELRHAPAPYVSALARQPIGRIAGGEALKHDGWQRLDTEYAKRFGVEAPSRS